MYRKYFKRVFDLVMALTIFLGFWWVFIIVALSVKIKLGSPVIFKQERPGKNGRIFIMYKFRSLSEDRDTQGKLLPSQERLTKFGRLLRSTSLDELPEIWNILRGDMSFIGPRPLLVRYLPRYNEFQFRRHEVKPGITGWAQVNGRNALSWDEKFKFDVEYVEDGGVLMDVKILFSTIKKVFTREGVFQKDETMTKEFFGN